MHVHIALHLIDMVMELLFLAFTADASIFPFPLPLELVLDLSRTQCN